MRYRFSSFSVPRLAGQGHKCLFVTVSETRRYLATSINFNENKNAAEKTSLKNDCKIPSFI